MSPYRSVAACLLGWLVSSVSGASELPAWWNAHWRFRTIVERPAPDRDEVPRPVEVVVDFPALLDRAGVAGTFDPNSVRVIQRDAAGSPQEVPSAWRMEINAERGIDEGYLTWMAHPRTGDTGSAELYFDVQQRGLQPARYDADQLPPENLLTNPGFEEVTGEMPAAWQIEPQALVSSDRFRHTSGLRSLKVVVDESTPESIGREVAISQRVDVRRYAGQEVVFECDLLAERAAYGAPVAIAIEQYRDDGSRIREDAVDPRWLNIELAPGQLVQFCERGRFSAQAATANVLVRVRCLVRDADTGRTVTGPDGCFTVWLDRLVLRPGERWLWPAPTHSGFVSGALPGAPVNRGFEFTGLRRVAFNGASEATLTAGFDDPDPRSVHWGLAAGTLEFWCRPSWNADDGAEHVFYEGIAYGHRLQSRLRKLGRDGGNRLEFSIADAGGTLRSVRAEAPLKAGTWHHVAATWDFPRAQLALFVDGRQLAVTGPGDKPWPSSLVSAGTTSGIGIAERDSRSMPMQAFLGGDRDCRPKLAADAVLDEVRISDCARYTTDFAPPREEFPLDEHTRALWHFEHEFHGIHDGDDRFVRGHPACELPRQLDQAPLDQWTGDRVERRMIVVAERPEESLFTDNRAENRLTVTRPFATLPDPRTVEYRSRQVERVLKSGDEEFTLTVGGDWEPLMESLSFELASGAPRGVAATVPHWRANDNVVPLSVEELSRTLAPGIDDEAQLAFEVFRYALATTNYFDAHYCETLPTRHRPRVSYTLIKALNIYPFDQCGPLNHTLRKLFLTAGISSQNASGTHHQFQQAFYQGSWRLFDLSPRVFWLNRDNTTVASRRAFEEDMYLKLRQGSGVQSALRGRRERPGLGTAERPHSMEFPLRAGERVTLGWQNEGRWFELSEDRQPIPLGKIPPYFGNGAILYQPSSGSEAAELHNVEVAAGDGVVTLRAQDPRQAASFTYRLHCPYILSDARVRGTWTASQPGSLRASLSFDAGRTWNEIWRNEETRGTLSLDLLEQVTARYAYWLKWEFDPDSDARLSDLTVRTTFVVSPLALPARLRRGENQIRLVGGPVQTPVKAVCRWYERHRSDLAIGTNGISYYLDGGQSHRNVLLAAPGKDVPLTVTTGGRECSGEIFLDGLPDGWTVTPERQSLTRAASAPPNQTEFVLRPVATAPVDPVGLDIVLYEGDRVRPVPIQVLVAPSALACEAEQAASIDGAATAEDSEEDSQGRIVVCRGKTQLAFNALAVERGAHALWLRARWTPGSSTQMELIIDGGRPRVLSATAMIGFTDWENPRRAHTKMFAHFGEAFGHWSWYRIGDIDLDAGPHRLVLTAGDGACLDALVLLPATPPCDRAAMNLFQNWNYSCRAADRKL